MESMHFNGYITEYNFIDGSTQVYTEFGLFDSDTGIWIPKKYGGSYGTLGHYYNFSVLMMLVKILVVMIMILIIELPKTNGSVRQTQILVQIIFVL